MKLAKTKLNGLNFWYREDDKFVGQRIVAGKYEEYETKLILRQVQDTAIAVDVGANIGYYTLLMAQKCKKVYAIEPDKENFEILKKNVEENKFTNVVILNVAAGEKKEKKYLIKDKNNYGNSHLNPSKSPFDKGDLQRISCLRLDDILINEHKIDLIKLDTQGWEPQVVEGAKRIIKRDSPILFLEYTPSEYKNNKMIGFLKNVYKSTWSIDYWFYICRKGIYVDTKTGYTDLWMKNDFRLTDFLDTFRFVQIKKVIKQITRIK
jgi:FkbM family methyltransferase